MKHDWFCLLRFSSIISILTHFLSPPSFFHLSISFLPSFLPSSLNIASPGLLSQHSKMLALAGFDFPLEMLGENMFSVFSSFWQSSSFFDLWPQYATLFLWLHCLFSSISHIKICYWIYSSSNNPG